MPWSTTDKHSSIVVDSTGYIASRSSGTTEAACRGTISRNSGKWYLEYWILSYSAYAVCTGFANASHSLTSHITLTANAFGVRPSDSALRRNNSNLLSAVTPVGFVRLAAIVRYAIDISAGRVWAAVDDGPWNNSTTANPATDTGGVTYSVTGPLFPAASFGGAGGAVLLMEGQTGAYAPPSGFLWWDGGTSPAYALVTPGLVGHTLVRNDHVAQFYAQAGSTVLRDSPAVSLLSLVGSVVITDQQVAQPQATSPVVFFLCGG